MSYLNYCRGEEIYIEWNWSSCQTTQKLWMNWKSLENNFFNGFSERINGIRFLRFWGRKFKDFQNHDSKFENWNFRGYRLQIIKSIFLLLLILTNPKSPHNLKASKGIINRKAINPGNNWKFYFSNVTPEFILFSRMKRVENLCAQAVIPARSAEINARQ